VHLRGLTDTKEGRLVVIGVVGGILMLVATAGNMAMAAAADGTVDDVRRALRRDLSALSDETIDGYPETAESIERAADQALVDLPARVVGSASPDDDEVVVAVQSGWGWQIRCVKAELRGDATVLTYVTARPC
jgi:hypothetical protein